MTTNVQEPGGPPRGEAVLMDRREMLDHLSAIGAGALAAALGGAALGGLLDAGSALAAPAKRKYRYGMVVDTRRCVGCQACVAACKAENKLPPGVAYNKVLEYEIGAHPDDRPVFATRPCMHCEKPACAPACPTGAISKRPQDGIVVIDYDVCAGAQACIKACPYGVPVFDQGGNLPSVAAGTAFAQVPSPELGQFRRRKKDEPPIGRARKCTFCLHLQDARGMYDQHAGRWPACAKTCTGRAIHFGDLNDPNSAVSALLKGRKVVRLKEARGTQPNVYYAL